MSSQKRKVQENAEICTINMMNAIDIAIEGNEDLAVIYGNSAIAAVILLFNKYNVDIETSEELFKEVWSQIVGCSFKLEK